MNELQSKLVDMLAWFHKFCEENELRYYIIAGTMLGAVRHGGFIPWDDDIDVGMPRSDYEKLRKLSLEQPKIKYMFEYPSLANTEYPFLWAKLYDTTTTLVEKQKYTIKRGIYIDIFPLDGIGNSMNEAIKNYEPIKRSTNLNFMISCSVLKRRKWYKNCLILIGGSIASLVVNKPKLAKKIDDSCKRFDFDSCKIVSNLMGGAHEKGLVKREYFGKPTEIKFENLTVYGLENPDLYLKSMYGDYMKLPPKEAQISYHDSEILDLNNGYLE